MTPHPTHDVLLVDPDDDVRAHLALYMGLHGCRVTGTRGADDTLRQLRFGFRPCVVVTDPRALGAECWDLVDYLRADSVLARVPLILATVDPTQVKCAHWRGVRACIAKPAAPVSYIDAIERQCRRRWRRLERFYDHSASAELLAPAPGAIPPLLRRHHVETPVTESAAERIVARARLAAGADRR